MHILLERENCLVRVKPAGFITEDYLKYYVENWRKPTKIEFESLFRDLRGLPVKVLEEILCRMLRGRKVIKWKLGEYKGCFEIKFLIP